MKATTTYILPTSRSIRSNLLQSSKTSQFLPNYFTMSEFLDRLLIVNDYVKIDDDHRTLLLLEAAKFKNFEKLKIEKNFFTFLKNSQYIFKFFEELAGELIDINALFSADIYGDYEEHITILSELHKRYETICENESVLDRIYINKKYQLNRDYIKQLGKVHIVIEGYLTNFEFQVLKDCATIIPLVIEINTTHYNKKMQSKFPTYELKNFYNYHLNISNGGIEVEQKISSSFENVSIKTYAFAERVLQVGFVMKKLYEFTQKGIEAQNIVVVVPDESFASLLRMYDDKHNFNFAMGTPLNEAKSIKVLKTCCDYLDNNSVQNTMRLNSEKNSLLFEGNSIKASEMLHYLMNEYRAVISLKQFCEIVDVFIECEPNKRAKKVLEDLRYHFESILPHLKELNLKSLLHLFLNRVNENSLDDVRGGKVTVMGVLESRFISYEGVIVVDFNEDSVPRRSEKDLFLNSTTRSRVELPSQEDRENLQKHYYYMLFSRAKEVAISYVQTTQAMPSRFLYQLGLDKSEVVHEKSYASILHPTYENKNYENYNCDTVQTTEYDFKKKPLSATGLKMFLECKRKFYLKYVEKLKYHDIPAEMPSEHEIGTALHEALKVVYQNQSRFSDVTELSKTVTKALSNVVGSNELQAFQLKLWQKKLIPFYEKEVARFEEGIEVKCCEESFNTKVHNISLTGQIDRIDITQNHTYDVIDYKSGSYPKYTKKSVENATDFQLEFYYLLAQNVGEVNSCYYYDLKNGVLVEEEFLSIKLERLKEILLGLSQLESFTHEKCEDIKVCQYCDYKYICQRN